MSLQRSLLVAVLIAAPGVAFAHTGHSPVSGFAAGMLHPLTGVDHLLAMVAVGLLAAQQGGRALLALPLAFLSMMALGGLLGPGAMGVSAVEAGILTSVLVLGGLVALGRPLPQSLAITVAGVFALFHGHAHGAEMPIASDLLAYGAGFLLATGGLHGLGIALGAGLARTGRLAFARYAGGVIVLCGLGLVAT